MDNNQTLCQFFHWYLPQDGAFWQHFEQEAPRLAANGITHAWLPPAYKGSSGAASVGYDVYDLYDLGEFDQKGTVATKYGSRDSYLKAIAAAQQQGIRVIADIVLNHRLGGDEKERFRVKRINPDNRNETIGEPFEIEGYTRFTFPGRAGQYSAYSWDFHSFSGVDHADNLKPEEQGIFKILNEYGDDWSQAVADEKGNFDYLLGADVEFRNPHVREELGNWGRWYLDTTKVSGLRLDALKHMSWKFSKAWIDAMRAHAGRELLIIGEYWTADDQEELASYIQKTEERALLFDSVLHYRLHQAAAGGYDLRQLFDNTLTARYPHLSVTFVENHDTQPLQALESTVQAWFRPLAYACILLREQGLPCVFYADLYGARYTDKGQEINMQPVSELTVLLQARQQYAYGAQYDHFAAPDLIGWVRQGINEKKDSGCAVIVSNHQGGKINMQMGAQHAGRTFHNLLNNGQVVTLDQEGKADFFVEGCGVAVWTAFSG